MDANFRTLLLLGLVALMLSLMMEDAEAKGLRMRVIGGSKSRSGGGKPWDRGRHNPSLFEQRYEDEYDDYSEFTRSGKKRACVGLCYYLKLLTLNSTSTTTTTPTPSPFRSSYYESEHHEEDYDDGSGSGSGSGSSEEESDISTTKKYVNPIIKFYGTTAKPCVGLCYYYKELGLPVPEQFKHYA